MGKKRVFNCIILKRVSKLFSILKINATTFLLQPQTSKFTKFVIASQQIKKSLLPCVKSAFCLLNSSSEILVLQNFMRLFVLWLTQEILWPSRNYMKTEWNEGQEPAAYFVNTGHTSTNASIQFVVTISATISKTKQFVPNMLSYWYLKLWLINFV
jgi:hypothetical protein